MFWSSEINKSVTLNHTGCGLETNALCFTCTVTDSILIISSVFFLSRIKEPSSWFWTPRHLKSWEEPTCPLTWLMASMVPSTRLPKPTLKVFLILNIKCSVSHYNHYIPDGTDLQYCCTILLKMDAVFCY